MSKLLGAIQTALLAAFALVVLLDRAPHVAFGGPLAIVLGDVIALSGVALILVAIRTMGKAVQVEAAPREGAGLVTRGVYAKLRHPIYTGIARALAAHGFDALRAQGIKRAMLFILSDNADAQAFWLSVGGRERTTLGLWSVDL